MKPVIPAMISFTILLPACAAVYPPFLDLPQDRSQLEARLKRHVEKLSLDIGERNCYRPDGLRRASEWIEDEFRKHGYTVSRRQVAFDGVKFGCKVNSAYNIIAELRGQKSPDAVLVVGAHYDSKVGTPSWHDHNPPVPNEPGTPGANDNGSGVAALLSIAADLAGTPLDKTVKFAAFVNEEPPFFQDPIAMGSSVFARESRERNESIIGAIVLDALGTYSVQPKMKRRRFGILPALIGLPNKSDYVAFLGNRASRSFMRECAHIFKKSSAMELRTVAIPAVVSTVAWSDDWSFWRQGYQAFTITDTAYLRSDSYHERSDTAEKLDYEAFSSVVIGIRNLLHELAAN